MDLFFPPGSIPNPSRTLPGPVPTGPDRSRPVPAGPGPVPESSRSAPGPVPDPSRSEPECKRQFFPRCCYTVACVGRRRRRSRPGRNGGTRTQAAHEQQVCLAFPREEVSVADVNVPLNSITEVSGPLLSSDLNAGAASAFTLLLAW